MKKIFTSIISVLLISSMLFMGCGEKRVDANTAADILINTMIKNKEADKFKTTFNEDASGFEKEFKDSFVSSFKTIFTSSLGISSSKQLDTLIIFTMHSRRKFQVMQNTKLQLRMKLKMQLQSSLQLMVLI